ncbi:MAG: DUF1565 domain-containing protein [Candidatus Lokiarchaeota archaeon]|nr:DUF1565 domain-containing protein [Candidatus Lokiarchaeota archaeon]
MKFKTKRLAILFLIGLVFSLTINYYSFFNTELKPGQSNEVNNVKKPKTSGVYTSIIIDDLLISNTTTEGNWAWAETQEWCSGSGTLLDPYIIESNIWNMSMRIDGLKINNSQSKHFIIRNCTFKWNELTNTIVMTGIYLRNTTHGQITDNMMHHLGYGIRLEDCNNINITGNTIYDQLDGIYLVDSNLTTISGNSVSNNGGNGVYMYNCDNNKILNNTFNENGDSGIYLEEYSNDNIISGNIIKENNYNGIYLYYYCEDNEISNNFINDTQDYGISLHWYSQDNSINNNVANYNGEIGIELYDYCEGNKVSYNIVSYNGLNGIGIYDFSDRNTVRRNLLYNDTIGVYIDNSDNNTIYERNVFSKNGVHAFDDGIDNAWSSTFIGNYWDNHTDPDFSPVDGIVDDPYTYIGGSAGSIDYFPLAEDGAPVLTIHSPQDGSKYGNTAPTFSITASDIYVVSMWYTLDDGLHNYTFTGEDDTISQSAWSAMSDGAITIKFYAIDIAGNIGTAEVTIGKNLPGEFDPTIVIVIVVVSIIGGIAVIAIAYRYLKKRKM